MARRKDDTWYCKGNSKGRNDKIRGKSHKFFWHLQSKQSWEEEMYARVFILLHCINFPSLFQLCPTYFLCVNASPARRSQLLWESQRSRLLEKLVKITFLHTYLWYWDPLVPNRVKAWGGNSGDHSTCTTQTIYTHIHYIYMHIHYRVYNEHQFILLYWRRKNIWGVIFKIWVQSAKEIIGAFSSLPWRRKEGLGKIMTMFPFLVLFSVFQPLFRLLLTF